MFKQRVHARFGSARGGAICMPMHSAQDTASAWTSVGNSRQGSGGQAGSFLLEEALDAAVGHDLDQDAAAVLVLPRYVRPLTHPPLIMPLQHGRPPPAACPPPRSRTYGRGVGWKATAAGWGWVGQGPQSVHPRTHPPTHTDVPATSTSICSRGTTCPSDPAMGKEEKVGDQKGVSVW